MSDELFDRVVRNSLRHGTASDPCPDPSEVAAFVLNNLTVTERRKIEAHVASCARCAAELAILVRLEEPAESDAHASGWWPRVRWAIPFATAALVFVIWRELPHDSQKADVVVKDAPAVVQEAPVEAVPDSEGVAASRRSDQARNAPTEKDQDRSTFERRRQGAEGAASKPDRSQDRRTTAEADQLKKSTLADAASPPPAQSEREAIAHHPTFRERVEGARPAVPVDTAAPQSAPVAPELRSSAAARKAERPSQEEAETLAPGRLSSAVAETVIIPLVVAARDGVQVRVINRNIERSTDQGRTWTTEREGLSGPLTVGICPAADVCWLAGASGFVVRREPSGRWIDARLPVESAVTTISATDALDASALTADQRRFTTADGGRTWTPAP